MHFKKNFQLTSLWLKCVSLSHFDISVNRAEHLKNLEAVFVVYCITMREMGLLKLLLCIMHNDVLGFKLCFILVSLGVCFFSFWYRQKPKRLKTKGREAIS